MNDRPKIVSITKSPVAGNDPTIDEVVQIMNDTISKGNVTGIAIIITQRGGTLTRIISDKNDSFSLIAGLNVALHDLMPPPMIEWHDDD